MARIKGTLRICSKGHRYYKSSSCPVCPICEKEHDSGADFLAVIAAPARRALEAKSIQTLQQLSQYSETELLKLHGMGPNTVPKLRQALKQAGLSFAKK